MATVDKINSEENTNLYTPAVKSIQYPGNKYASSVYQKIINEIPPHDFFISAFMGTCAVLANKKPANKMDFGVEINLDPVHSFWSSIAATKKIEWYQGDFIEILLDPFHPLAKIIDNERTVIFVDPPYLMSTRCGKNLYGEYELSKSEHRNLITLLTFQRCKLIITHPRCPEYDKLCKRNPNFRIVEYQVATRGGVKTEAMYLNFPPPKQLHQYNFLGENKTDRQRIKRKISSLKSKLMRLPVQERNALLETIKTL